MGSRPCWLAIRFCLRWDSRSRWLAIKWKTRSGLLRKQRKMAPRRRMQRNWNPKKKNEVTVTALFHHDLSRRALIKLAGISVAGVGSLKGSTVVSLFDGKTLDGWIQIESSNTSGSTGWVVKDGAMASTGAGRGVIYTVKDYGRYRLIFTMRHVSGMPDHQACVLIFCTHPQADERLLDALAGSRFKVPKVGHSDYRQW